MRYVACLAVFSVSLFAQQPLKFEVASVKVRPVGSLITVIGGSSSGSRLTLEAMSLIDLVGWAYDLKSWQIAGGPGWAGIQRDRSRLDDATARFDVASKAEGDAARSDAEFRQMLQALLAERFHVVSHRESRELPVYVLVVDKNGSKLHESAAGAKGTLRMNGGGKITGSGGTITQLVNWFSNANGVERPLIDQTGLAGRYDFTLTWSNPLASAPDSSEPSIFTAMPGQLGLRLEPRRMPLEVFVIDHAEMPDAN